MVMDGKTFDGWTRRRAGMAAGSAMLALLGLSRTDAAAKPKKKNGGKRCKRIGDACVPGRHTCCGKSRCEARREPGYHFCCKPRGDRCVSRFQCCVGTDCHDGFCRASDVWME
jgi:hypothetical protein